MQILPDSRRGSLRAATARESRSENGRLFVSVSPLGLRGKEKAGADSVVSPSQQPFPLSCPALLLPALREVRSLGGGLSTAAAGFCQDAREAAPLSLAMELRSESATWTNSEGGRRSCEGKISTSSAEPQASPKESDSLAGAVCFRQGGREGACVPSESPSANADRSRFSRRSPFPAERTNEIRWTAPLPQPNLPPRMSPPLRPSSLGGCQSLCPEPSLVAPDGRSARLYRHSNFAQTSPTSRLSLAAPRSPAASRPDTRELFSASSCATPALPTRSTAHREAAASLCAFPQRTCPSPGTPPALCQGKASPFSPKPFCHLRPAGESDEGVSAFHASWREGVSPSAALRAPVQTRHSLPNFATPSGFSSPPPLSSLERHRRRTVFEEKEIVFPALRADGASECSLQTAEADELRRRFPRAPPKSLLFERASIQQQELVGSAPCSSPLLSPSALRLDASSPETGRTAATWTTIPSLSEASPPVPRAVKEECARGRESGRGVALDPSSTALLPSLLEAQLPSRRTAREVQGVHDEEFEAKGEGQVCDSGSSSSSTCNPQRGLEPQGAAVGPHTSRGFLEDSNSTPSSQNSGGAGLAVAETSLEDAPFQSEESPLASGDSAAPSPLKRSASPPPLFEVCGEPLSETIENATQTASPKSGTEKTLATEPSEVGRGKSPERFEDFETGLAAGGAVEELGLEKQVVSPLRSARAVSPNPSEAKATPEEGIDDALKGSTKKSAETLPSLQPSPLWSLAVWKRLLPATPLEEETVSKAALEVSKAGDSTEILSGVRGSDGLKNGFAI